ncbi:MAG: hypothetical protein ACRD4O_10935 [Bryobacteraceae bacterium]
MTVPAAAEPYPDEDQPSHLQEVHAELVAQLPVPDEQGGTHHTMPKLTTSSEYEAYIRTRTEAWRASRSRNASSMHRG